MVMSVNEEDSKKKESIWTKRDKSQVQNKINNLMK